MALSRFSLCVQPCSLLTRARGSRSVGSEPGRRRPTWTHLGNPNRKHSRETPPNKATCCDPTHSLLADLADPHAGTYTPRLPKSPEDRVLAKDQQRGGQGGPYGVPGAKKSSRHASQMPRRRPGLVIPPPLSGKLHLVWQHLAGTKLGIPCREAPDISL